jgi:four helix bundle protein
VSVRASRDLHVWQRAHQLALAVYATTRLFPREERYGLTSQLRRASVSIPANIAEGCGRNSTADFSRFLHIAAGSASELEYHLLLARDLGMLDGPTFARLANEVTDVKRMLSAFTKRLIADG